MQMYHGRENLRHRALESSVGEELAKVWITDMLCLRLVLWLATEVLILLY